VIGYRGSSYGRRRGPVGFKGEEERLLGVGRGMKQKGELFEKKKQRVKKQTGKQAAVRPKKAPFIDPGEKKRKDDRRVLLLRSKKKGKMRRTRKRGKVFASQRSREGRDSITAGITGSFNENKKGTFPFGL